MNFQELGELLQQEREAQGLTIESVMETTKISRINLVAIEGGDRSSLPHPVYTKGFVKSYAKLLGLDADELAMVVDSEYKDADTEGDDVFYEVSPVAGKAFDAENKPVRKHSVWPSILLVIVLGGAIVGLVLFLNKAKVDQSTDSVSVETTEQAPETKQVPPVEEELVEQSAQADEKVDEAVQAEEAEPATQVRESDAGIQDEKSMAAEPADTAEPVAEEVPLEAEAKPEEADMVEPAAAQPEDVEHRAEQAETDDPDAVKYAHVLVIRATTDKGCWIGLWKGDDTKMARDFVLANGEPLRLMFNNPRRIRIGNVAGVTVTYNGKPYQLDKNKSNIQTLTFGYN